MSYYPGPVRQAVQSRYREDFEEVEDLASLIIRVHSDAQKC